ncbi:MAG: penicillin acylase family protein, partial [Streptosporangiales bacterium]
PPSGTLRTVLRSAGARSAMTRAGAALRTVSAVAGAGGQGIGSNSWAVAGSRTASGKPILANDPHLGPALPSIWYQMGLHCAPVRAACPYDVAGYTFAGTPGVVIGHNDRVAWGFTNLGPDVSDLYLERVKGDRYLYRDRWRPLAKRTETIRVAGGEPVRITVRATRHGPLLSDVSDDVRAVGRRASKARTGREHGPYAVALRWTALTPGRTADAIFVLDTASSFADLRDAARLFDVPAQNLVYADVDGHIGYQAPGRIPIRRGYDGRWPAIGWTGKDEWEGFIPFRALPHVLDPEEGYVVTANQAAVGRSYPYLLTKDWDYGYRSRRITDLITSADGPITVASTRRMQLDTYNPMAAELVPYLLRARLPAGAGQARDLLRGWDFDTPPGSAAAAYWNAVWAHLLVDTFGDELPRAARPDGGSRWFAVVSALLATPRSPWWDDRRTSGVVETRDDMLAAAMSEADEELRETLGPDPSAWRWGELHTLMVRNQSFGTSGIGVVERLVNRGPLHLGGGSSVVDATGWTAGAGYEVDWVPSMRMVVNLADLDRSSWVNLTGASGHAFHRHYFDQARLWARGNATPMPWGRHEIAAATEDRLVLRPAGS